MKLEIGAVAALMLVGLGVAIGWFADRISTGRRSRRGVSRHSDLVVSLLPDEQGVLPEDLSEDLEKPTCAAHLIIVTVIEN
jgi:hypothetical protein